MVRNKCLVCGSFNFRADRALSGRLICLSCGNPFGVRKNVRNKLVNNVSLYKSKHYFFIILFVFIFLIIIT